jgi:hypothetical protein
VPDLLAKINKLRMEIRMAEGFYGLEFECEDMYLTIDCDRG